MPCQILYTRVFLPRRAWPCFVWRSIRAQPQLVDMPLRKFFPFTTRSVSQSQRQSQNQRNLSPRQYRFEWGAITVQRPIFLPARGARLAVAGLMVPAIFQGSSAAILALPG